MDPHCSSDQGTDAQPAALVIRFSARSNTLPRNHWHHLWVSCTTIGSELLREPTPSARSSVAAPLHPLDPHKPPSRSAPTPPAQLPAPRPWRSSDAPAAHNKSCKPNASLATSHMAALLCAACTHTMRCVRCVRCGSVVVRATIGQLGEKKCPLVVQACEG
jgi:hypothetical protein